MSRRQRKQVSGLEMGFICCQAFAAMMLLGILIQFISAKTTFEEGVEYQPVTITWTASESYVRTYMEDGEKRTETTYDNSYSYTVDGVEYTGIDYKASHSVTPGSQDTWYYNPNHPEKITEWSSMEEQMGSTKLVCFLFVILQILAIFCLIKMLQKKRQVKLDNRAYEEKIRQDMQKNREIYRMLHLAIDEQKAFAVLEPLRARIYTNQRKAAKLKKQANVVIGGNIVSIIIFAAVKLIGEFRYHRIIVKLEADRTVFYTEYKKMIAEPVLRKLFGESHYRPSQGFSPRELLDFDLLKGIDFDKIQSEDYLEGIYKGVSYQQADVRSVNNVEESDFTEETGGLCGRILIYDYKKDLNGDIYISSKHNSYFNIRDLNKVEMENVVFNNKFDVYTADEHMAYYLLTPQFMEYLMNLDLRGEMVFRFTSNKIYVFRNHIAGIFEPDLRKTLDIPYEIGKSYNELKEILDFIDILNLDHVMDQETLRDTYTGNAEEKLENESETGYEEDWNKPVSQNAGSSGLKLRL
ncbi:MAG: DUF3137 domain-containing protein [Lachnospiraceae bacterium]